MEPASNVCAVYVDILSQVPYQWSSPIRTPDTLPSPELKQPHQTRTKCWVKEASVDRPVMEPMYPLNIDWIPLDLL